MSMSDDVKWLTTTAPIILGLMLFCYAFAFILAFYPNRKCINNNTVVESKVSTETSADAGTIDLSQYTVVIDEDNKTVHLKAK